MSAPVGWLNYDNDGPFPIWSISMHAGEIVFHAEIVAPIDGQVQIDENAPVTVMGADMEQVAYRGRAGQPTIKSAGFGVILTLNQPLRVASVEYSRAVDE